MSVDSFPRLRSVEALLDRTVVHPLGTQNPLSSSWAGRLALAAFVKRPQADVQIGADKRLSLFLTLSISFAATSFLFFARIHN
jgi:hypothetical protein